MNKMILAIALLLTLAHPPVNAEEQKQEQQQDQQQQLPQTKKSPFRVISETIPSKNHMTLVLLSNDFMNDLKLQLNLYAKSDKATQAEIINTISALLFVESFTQDEQTYSYCEVAAEQYAKLRQAQDKELDPELAQEICMIVMDSHEVAAELVTPYYVDSGNRDNMNRKISRLIRNYMIMVIDQILASEPGQ